MLRTRALTLLHICKGHRILVAHPDHLQASYCEATLRDSGEDSSNVVVRIRLDQCNRSAFHARQRLPRMIISIINDLELSRQNGNSASNKHISKRDICVFGAL